MHRIHSTNIHFFILILGLTAIASLFLMLRLDTFWSKILIILIGFYYFAWGLVHHYLSRNLHVKIILEYLVISVLGTVLLLTLTARM